MKQFAKTPTAPRVNATLKTHAGIVKQAKKRERDLKKYDNGEYKDEDEEILFKKEDLDAKNYEGVSGSSQFSRLKDFDIILDTLLDLMHLIEGIMGRHIMPLLSGIKHTRKKDKKRKEKKKEKEKEKAKGKRKSALTPNINPKPKKKKKKETSEDEEDVSSEEEEKKESKSKSSSSSSSKQRKSTYDPSEDEDEEEGKKRTPAEKKAAETRKQEKMEFYDAQDLWNATQAALNAADARFLSIKAPTGLVQSTSLPFKRKGKNRNRINRIDVGSIFCSFFFFFLFFFYL